MDGPYYSSVSPSPLVWVLTLTFDFGLGLDNKYSFLLDSDRVQYAFDIPKV